MSEASAETWLPVVGWEGLYEVSDLGRVRSVDRTIVDVNGMSKRYRSCMLKPMAGRKGYLRVSLQHAGTIRLVSVHRSVLQAFVGPAPAGHEGCHWNGDPGDNSLSNLRWDSPSANVLDNVRNGVHPEARRTHCGRRHLLAMPNLAPANLRAGHRACLACDRGRAEMKNAKRDGRPVPDLNEAADRHYVRIMGLRAA